jgi:hypothetical protein
MHAAVAEQTLVTCFGCQLLLAADGHRNLHLTQPHSLVECMEAWKPHVSLAAAVVVAAAAAAAAIWAQLLKAEDAGPCTHEDRHDHVQHWL